METYKIRVKIGDHEFEAEGPADAVKEQFAAFKELVGAAPAPKGTPPPAKPSLPDSEDNDSREPGSSDRDRLKLLFSEESDGRLITLRIPPQGERREADALLLIALGYRLLKGVDEVLVTVLKEASHRSGISIQRVDRVASRDVSDNLFIKTGSGKGGKYRLTNTGITRAKELMETALSNVS